MTPSRPLLDNFYTLIFTTSKQCFLATMGQRKMPMPNVQKISVALTPEMLTMLKEAVESGEYTSTSEVIRDALRSWKARRALQEREVEELRRLWDEGINSGEGRFSSIDEIKAEARRRLKGKS
jgi:antitoxin ParD1/3/4